MITLVIGGVRSGKSELAESMISQSVPALYIATARSPGRDDPEGMRVKVEAHRARRPDTWSTLEVGPGMALVDVVRAEVHPVLIDSLGTWVAGHEHFEAPAEALAEALAVREADTVIVTDECGMSVHPTTDSGRRFQGSLGAVNRIVADVSDRVLLAIAGRVLRLESPDVYSVEGGSV